MVAASLGDSPPVIRREDEDGVLPHLPLLQHDDGVLYNIAHKAQQLMVFLI